MILIENRGYRLKKKSALENVFLQKKNMRLFSILPNWAD